MGTSKERVRWPAAGLIATGTVGGLWWLANLVFLLVADPERLAELQRRLPLDGEAALAIRWGLILANLAACGFLIYAGLRMLQLEQWVVCVVACFVSLVPCLGCCCLGIPFGIWGLVVLMNEEVKKTFTN